MYRLAVLAMTVVPAVATAVPCQRVLFHAQVLTPPAAAIAPGGGFVVAAIAARDGSDGPGDVASQPTWRVHVGARSIAPAIRVVAPGLDVYDVGDVEGEVVLDAGGTKVKAVRVDKYGDLDAPDVRSLEHAEHTAGKSRSATVTATFGAKVPEHALAVVVFGADGVARSWQAVSAGATTAQVYGSVHCVSLLNGTIASQPDDELQLAWLADSGRLSKKSAKVKVIRAK